MDLPRIVLILVLLFVGFMIFTKVVGMIMRLAVVAVVIGIIAVVVFMMRGG